MLAAAGRDRGSRLGRENAGQALGAYLFSDNKSTRRKGNKGKAVLTLPSLPLLGSRAKATLEESKVSRESWPL